MEFFVSIFSADRFRSPPCQSPLRFAQYLPYSPSSHHPRITFIFLLPTSKTTGEPIILVILQGAEIRNTEYTQIAEEIQKRAPYPLHVVIPACMYI